MKLLRPTRILKLDSSSASRIVPLLALSVLLLAVMVKGFGPRTGQTFDGLIMINGPLYEFYPGLKECPARGIAYWLVSNDDLDRQLTSSLEHSLEYLGQGTWRVNFRGDLSRVGRYGYWNRYWRELRVVNVYEVAELECKTFNGVGRNATGLWGLLVRR